MRRKVTRVGGKERVTAVEAGRRLGLTRQAIGQWGARPGAPVALDGDQRLYVWPDFPRWREAELGREAEPKDFEEARTRKMAAEARLAELELAKAERSLVTVDDAAAVVDEAFDQLRSNLLTLPQRWAPQVVGQASLPAVVGILDRAIEEALTALAREAA